MTTQTNTPQDEEIKKVWTELWKFAKGIIIWDEGTIDFDDFFEGKDYFEVKIKDTKRY